MGHVLKENLNSALVLAIDEQEKIERKMFGKMFMNGSAMLCGWKQNLKDLQENNLIIKYR